MKRYIDMTPEERLAVHQQNGEALLAIEACRSPSPQAVRTLVREMAFIERVARSRGDRWAQA